MTAAASTVFYVIEYKLIAALIINNDDVFCLYFAEYARNLMTKSWRNGTSPKTSDKVHNFVHKHVHDNFIVGSNNRRHVPKPEIMCGAQEP